MRTRSNCFPSLLPKFLMCQQNIAIHPGDSVIWRSTGQLIVKYLANRKDQLHRFCIECFLLEQKAEPTSNMFGAKSEKQSKT